MYYIVLVNVAKVRWELVLSHIFFSLISRSTHLVDVWSQFFACSPLQVGTCRLAAPTRVVRWERWIGRDDVSCRMGVTNGIEGVCVLCYIQSIGNLGRVVGLSRFAPPHFDPEHCLSNPLNFWEKIIWGRQGIRGRPNDGRWCPMDGRFTGMTPNVVRDLVRIHASQVLYCLVVWLEIDPKISSSCTPSMHLQHDQCRSIQSHDILSGICMVG